MLHIPAYAAAAHTTQLGNLAGSDTDSAFTLTGYRSATHEWPSFPEHIGQYAAYVVEGAFFVRHRDETIQMQKGDILHAPALDSYHLARDPSRFARCGGSYVSFSA